jgi:APA family basic amino acid/polyamine antiporter
MSQGHTEGRLVRGMGLRTAVLLNMLDMVGVGPFITLPLIVGAMGGPQAMLGWVFGAFFAMCDGLVCSELAASMPNAGGSYYYLKEIYGPTKLGRLISFLFIWQLTFSAPLSIASGAIGLAHYSSYFFPVLQRDLASREMSASVPVLGLLQARATVAVGTFLALGIVILAVFLLYRRITAIARLSNVLSGGVFLALGWIIFAGITHFNPGMAFSFPKDAFHLGPEFFTGLGAAMLVATYDYWGYYNVCYLGEEIKEPEKNIPRAVMISIVVIAILYITMNISVIGVIPWQELMATAKSDTRFYVMSVLMQRVYGPWAGYAITALIVWTAFASVFSLLLGYSRVPYAAALDGNYFKIFGKLHREHKFPYVSLLVLGAVALAFCFLSLADVIAALVVIRILLQFLLQAIGVIILRKRRPDLPRPFRMWLYPLPALIAAAGFVYILFSRPNFGKEIRYAVVLLVVGTVIYMVRAAVRKEWPFGNALELQASAPIQVETDIERV